MPRKIINIAFPAAGVVRRFGLRSGANGRGPYPAPWSTNVRLEDALTNRLRGGSFPHRYAYLLAEDGKKILTEDGSPIILGLYDTVVTSYDYPRYVYLVTENGDRIITENGDPIVLGPQYSVATGYGRIWVNDGDDAPASGTADCLYRDRLFRTSDNIIFVSRQGDTTDWDYGGPLEDTGRAMVFQLSEGGEVGGDVVSLAPHKDSHLLCFTATSTWILTGDPATGSLRNVSREVGIVAAKAWCKNHDTVYFLSSHGLYSVGADGSGLKPVSEDKIPEHLIDVVDSDCVLDYFHTDRGVYIYLSTAAVSWFYDTARDQFWPFDTSTANSHVLIGPFQLGQANSYGRILSLHGNIAEDSADVTWRIVLGDTAEEAAANGKTAIEAALAGTDYSSYVVSQGTWSAGRAHLAYPRNRAVWCCIWLSSAGDWAYETASLDAMVSGKWR